MLDLHCQMILEEYQQYRGIFEKMSEIVCDEIGKLVRDNGIYITALESRVKTESSLSGKLELKGGKYKTLSDITDIMGARVVAFYSEDVDKVAALIETLFDIDWENSVDKRKIHELDRFGYMSLHYICRIPPSLYQEEGCPELNEFRFEVQMRTALQHVWATMHHDTGYKSGVEVPREYLRSLNRLAGLLELADEQFSRIRTEINDYRRQVSSLVADGNFDAVALDGDSYKSYLELAPFNKLVERIAAINQAEIYRDPLQNYLQPMLHMGFTTLGDIEHMKRDCSEPAYQLALHQLAATDLDIVAQSVALQNLCVVHIVRSGGGELELVRFYNHLNGGNNYNVSRAQRTLEQLSKIKIV